MERKEELSQEYIVKIVDWWLGLVPSDERDKPVLGSFTFPEPIVLTPKQMAEEMRKRTDLGKKFLEFVRREYEKAKSSKV
jgi:hypothetical protein